MRVLIVYGTTEGHTRELANFVARQFRERGHAATVEEAGRSPDHPDPEPYDVVFLAASLHVGRYQPALVAFARRHHEQLNPARSAFISVSLSAAGENPHDWEGVAQCVARFEQETAWTPGAIHHAAGAIRYSQYDFFKRLALQHIAAKRGQRTVTSHDYDLTDYAALARFVLEFAGLVAPPAAAAAEAEAVAGGDEARAGGSPRPGVTRSPP